MIREGYVTPPSPKGMKQDCGGADATLPLRPLGKKVAPQPNPEKTLNTQPRLKNGAQPSSTS